MTSGPEPPPSGLSKHRLEMLTDGVYAIAITLLVLELKVPGHAAGESQVDLLHALGHLIPKFVAWLMSFFILCIFWIAHHRMFLWVRSVDMKAMWITLLTLLGASFLPFASALVGEHASAFISQLIYAADMAFMGLMNLWLLGHLQRHPELCREDIHAGVFRGARFRCWGIVGTAALAVAIALVEPRFATSAFGLMAVVSPASRKYEQRPAAPTAVKEPA
jgi:uncharacterized membrane protein